MLVSENSVILRLYKKHPDVPTPKYGTTMSACFDLTFFPTEDVVRGYDATNKEVERPVRDGKITINAGDRLLVPTGLIMALRNVPYHYSIRLHPRSGLSLKRGLILANSEGVIDMDYNQEVFAMMTNISYCPQDIVVGERVCQGEICINALAYFEILDNMPEPISERDGGFGSTGVI
jgi:dUTP pyrophosphatase